MASGAQAVKSSQKHIRFAISTAAAVIVLGTSLATSVFAQTLPAQTVPAQPTVAQPPNQPATDASTGAPNVSQTSDNLSLTVSETEGPYYKAGSPEATNLVQPSTPGQVITITGQVLDQNGNPVANAWLDFWQANASGAYDNSGYTLRGHQYTDANGYYTLTTVVPGLYPGRTEHIHVKVQAPNGRVLTTQLFFPGVGQNSRDSIYDQSLLLNVADNSDGTLSAAYNFVVVTA
jgi:protocatechuate 3,4-dioxygenase beta subunit